MDMEISEYLMWVLAGLMPTPAGLSVLSTLYGGKGRSEYRLSKLEVKI